MAASSTTIIAISRQLGASSHSIAEMVADQLKLPLFDQEIINRAAAAAGVEPDVIIAAESVPSVITRIVERLGRHPVAMEPESLPLTVLPNDLILTSSDYRYLIDSVVQQVTQQQSAVILGHGAAQTLADRPGVLRVLVLAPFETRIRRHAEQTGVTLEQARREVRENDKSRAEFFRHYYDMDWLNARRYDLVLNTGRLSDTIVAALIVQTARAHLGGGAALTTEQLDPVTVVMAFQARQDAQSLDSSLMLVADNAIFDVGTGHFAGKEAIGQFLRDTVFAVATKTDALDVAQVQGDQVVCHLTLSDANTHRLGLAAFPVEARFVVQDGRIQRLSIEAMPESQATLRAIQADLR